jgi:hypothetical protein
MMLFRLCRHALAFGCIVVFAYFVTGCGSSAPVSTPADVTICKQWSTYESDSGENPLATFESEWEADAPSSSQLDGDVTAYLALMQAGGWEPGSGEQTQTAQAGVTISQYCQQIGVPSGD